MVGDDGDFDEEEEKKKRRRQQKKESRERIKQAEHKEQAQRDGSKESQQRRRERLKANMNGQLGPPYRRLGRPPKLPFQSQGDAAASTSSFTNSFSGQRRQRPPQSPGGAARARRGGELAPSRILPEHVQAFRSMTADDKRGMLAQVKEAKDKADVARLAKDKTYDTKIKNYDECIESQEDYEDLVLTVYTGVAPSPRLSRRRHVDAAGEEEEDDDDEKNGDDNPSKRRKTADSSDP